MEILKNKHIQPPPRGQRAGGHRASGYLLVAIVTAILVSVVSVSMAKINHSLFSGTNSNKIVVQAQEYAVTKAEFLRAIKYDDITVQNRSLINNSGDYYDEVVVGAETAYPGNEDIKQRMCTVNVYKGEDILPRCSLNVVKVSAGKESGLPAGSIIPWYGQISNIPDGFALCNGSNGTPDLRNKFLVGAGSTYALGATGGADTVKLTAANTPAHIHGIGYNNANNYGWRPATKATGTTVACTLDSKASYQRHWNGSGGTNDLASIGTGTGAYKANELTSLPVAATNTGGTTAHENRPPYYALYYIMKL